MRALVRRAALRLPPLGRVVASRDAALVAIQAAEAGLAAAQAGNAAAVRAAEAAIAERDAAAAARDAMLAERDAALAARDAAAAQVAAIAAERDALQREVDSITTEAGFRRDLPDGDPAANPNIVEGRNIRAGYRRGYGIQSGELAGAIGRDPDYRAAVAAAGGRSIVAEHALMNLFLIVKYADIAGHIIEFGSYNGGSAMFLACLAQRLRPGCKVFALDTFAGMPPADPLLDYHREGDFADARLEELVRLRDAAGLDNLIYLQGLFQESVERIPAADRRVFLSHVDCDIHASVAFATAWAMRHGVAGGYIVFDDPLYSTCLGALGAVEKALVQEAGVLAEQAYPHLVYRYPPVGG